MADGTRRDLLLPALHAVQASVGWISRGALNYICRRLTVPPAELWGVVTFYHLLSTQPRPPIVAHVCDDIACRIRGGEALCEALEQTMGPPGAPGETGGATAWKRSPCLGQCERAPAVLLTVAGETPRTITVAPVEDGLASVLDALRDPPDTSDTRSGASSPAERRRRVLRSVPQVGQSGLRLLGRIGRVDPTSLAAYRASGGYRALARAIELGPAGVIAEVSASKLLGRGGAAFPTGRKWDAVAKAEARPHYLVCNADESEPGTFKDRLLMEEDPFALVEGMTIAGFATGCERGFLYLRGEYPLAAERMAGAIAAARAAGLLGADVIGAGFSFDIEIRRGAGAYICGEETALFNSIEGKRGEPRNKPPFPVQVGLFGQPTVVNNVETLVNVPALLREGGAAYAGIGTEGSTGPKLFCVSGEVARPGLYEVPFGITLRQLLDLAGAAARPRGAARRRRGRVRRPGRPRRAADLRGHAGDRRHARLRSRHGLRRVRRPARHRAPHRRVLPRRVVRPVRAVPRRDRPAGRAAGAAARSAPARLRRRGAGAPQGSRPGDARRLDLRPRTDGLERDRVRHLSARDRRETIVNPEPIWFRPPPPPSRPPAAPSRPAAPPVDVIIDGQRVSVAGGATVLDACRARGIDIPTLCFLQTLTPVNVCRVCVVEVAGSRALVPACSRRVEPGMTILTESERVRVSRRMVLELLASSVDLSTAPGSTT